MSVQSVRVPASFIANKPVNYVGEMFSVLGVPMRVGELEIPPPVFGCLPLLELISSEFYRLGAAASYIEFGRALAIFVHRRDAGAWVRDYIEDRPSSLDDAAQKCMRAGGEELMDRIGDVEDFLLDTPFTGFEMLPGASRPAGPFVFDGVVMGAVALLGGQYGGMSPDAVFWETPLALLGHLAAANAKSQGTQGVSRPKDEEDIRRQLKLARERAERGEPQPWEVK